MVINSNDIEISVSTASTVTGELLNYALQQLEERALAILRCDSPEAVIGKIICGDIVPALSSVVNISEDDFGIWNAQLRLKATEHSIINTSVEEVSTVTSNSVEESVDKSGSHDSVDEMKEVLPIALQLRPYWPERGTNGLFRLFFFEEDLVTVTQYSPWVFYPEVLKNKDTIMHSIRTYAALPATKQFVKHYFTMANLTASSNKSNPQSEALKPVNPPSRKSNRHPPNKTHSTPAPTPALPTHKYVSYFVPPEQIVFNLTTQDLSRIPLNAQSIPDEVALDIAGRYSFLSKLGDFSARLKRAQQNQRSRARRQTANESTTTATSKGADVVEVDAVDAVEHTTIRKETKVSGKAPVKSSEIGDLEGEGIHKLIKSMSDKTNSNNKGRKAPTADKTSATYTSLLQKYGCSGEVETEINARILMPAALETKTAATISAESSTSTSESNVSPTFKLLVLEVFVNLPKPTFKAAVPNSARLDSAQSITSTGTTATANLNSTSNDHHLYSIDLHEVVGIFNVNNERAPPNLELGLADWSRFRQLASHHHLHRHRATKPKPSSSSSSSSSSSTSSTIPNGKRASVTPPITSSYSSSSVASNSSMTTQVQDKSWSYDNTITGVAAYRAMLSSSREFEFLILGTTPDRQHLEQSLPRNIKKWLGLPDTKMI